MGCIKLVETGSHIYLLNLGEAKVVVVPAFADSISEGDVRFDKGNKLRIVNFLNID